jgi:hypothetical protein
MKATAWFCDWCGEPILADRTTFEVATGPERLRRPQLDLCGSCAAEFWTWVSMPAPGTGPTPCREEARRGSIP